MHKHEVIEDDPTAPDGNDRGADGGAGVLHRAVPEIGEVIEVAIVHNHLLICQVTESKDKTQG